MRSGQCSSYGQRGEAMLLSRSRERRFLLIVPALAAVCGSDREPRLRALQILLRAETGRSHAPAPFKRPIELGSQRPATHPAGCLGRDHGEESRQPQRERRALGPGNERERPAVSLGELPRDGETVAVIRSR
jgi:hypothetical protein